MKKHRRKHRPGGSGEKEGLPAKPYRQLTTCEYCGHKLCLDDILFIEDGVYASYQLKANRGSLDFDLYEICGDPDSYFSCRNCGQELDELTRLWNLDQEREIIRRLK